MGRTTQIPKVSVTRGNSKAFQLLITNKPIKDRAQEYSESSKRVIMNKILSPLIEKVESLKDKKFSLEDFSLLTDRNAGIQAASREEVADRFAALIQLNWEIALAEAELKNKAESFTEYFN